ncbi:equilibrative nucleoside transporter [Chloropicon primus]|uniref:Equilibrative nucleoside transporter n=1 Tax=Chloropicon primus TaxID=1764295 RepID=A0A5B8MKA7_9CHLO|nr:equilibrative nucleoside transporter [Chloropicon primus]UPR00279.1 equilibrative nucleoside transporter [Chloropicon primus]|mmetsp:Transcript_921/g.2727  ORF Transcript_921/g.2727 Transcript_921/m.2727 type:complete len:441 (+) Transcript_921:498-1820(+)|eukprot:QDZ21068.1 equilibrative nucleoside transporter [Chloropicon primus]
MDQLPKDRLAYLCMLCLGIGSLLPWNAFVTAVDYYQHFYPQYHPDRVIPVLYMTINVIVTGLLVKFGSSIDLNTRILFGFAAYSVSMMGVPVTDRALFPHNDDMHGGGNQLSMIITLCFVAVIAVANGFVQGSLFGLTGPLPVKYTSALVVGTAVSGVFISVLRIGTKIAFGDSPNGLVKGVYVYFAAGGVFSLFCMYLHQRVVPHLPIIKWQRKQEALRRGSGTPLLKGYSSSENGNGSSVNIEIAEKYNALEHPTAIEAVSKQKDEGETSLQGVGEVQLMPIFKELWMYAMAVFIGYLVTLSIFPGVLAENLKSSTLKSWYSLFLITVFNLGDMTGKMCPQRYLVKDGGILFAFSIMRIAFVPIYAVFVQEGLQDIAFFIVTVSLGLTNGYLTTAAMATAPTLFDGQKAEVAGTMMVFFLLFGLSSGAMAGWLWVFIS